MNDQTIFDDLRNVKTMPELDAMRVRVVDAMKNAGPGGWSKVQKAFLSAKNRLRRIPISERSW